MKIKLVILLVSASKLNAQDVSYKTLPVKVASALQEYKIKKRELHRHLLQEKEARIDSVPDFLGVRDTECILPKAAACSQDTCHISDYLNAMEDGQMQRVLALNFIGKMFQQRPLNYKQISFLADKYDVSESYVINGVDVRTRETMAIHDSI